MLVVSNDNLINYSLYPMLDLVVQFLHTTRLSINFGIILLIFKMKYKKETLFATTALVSITLPVFVVYI